MTGTDGTRRLLIVVGCVVCLLAVSSALPAADPRLDAPGTDGGEPVAGDWESIADTTDPAEKLAESADQQGDEDDAQPEPTDPDIEISGTIEPGNEVTVSVDGATPFDERSVVVNGEPAGETDFGRLEVTVPYAESMTVGTDETNASRTVDVPTTATIEPSDGAAPARDLEVAAAVGTTPVTDATVFRDGDAVATTDEEGSAAVPLPETAGPTDLRVERGPVEGDRTVEVAEPDVEFVSPLLFPGSLVPVSVSADGASVPNATVSLENGGTATTGDDGRARLWFPIADEATVTAEVGAETATATVGDLYLRLTAIVVLGPGLLIGGAVTYLRLVAARDRRPGGGLTGRTGISGLFVAIADVLGGLFDRLGRRRRSFPRPTVSSSLSRLGRGLSAVGTAVGSLGSAFAALSVLGSLGRSSGSGSNRPLSSVLRERFGRGSDDSEDRFESTDRSGRETPALAAEPLSPRGPRAEVRSAWHGFLDRLGVERRETTTPGQVARRALADGFPAASVRRLVAVFRDVEYGGREPTPDRVATARAAADELIDHEPDDGDSDSDEVNAE